MRRSTRESILVAAGLAAAVAAVTGVVVWRRRRRRSSSEPLVVFFHGKGGRDATYEAILDPLGVDYILPHGYSIGGDRHEWWGMSSQTEAQKQYARDVEEAVESVLPDLQALRARRPLILAGHSQGGQLAASLAMRGLAPAVVASAWVPEPLVTSSPSPIVFVHGTDDPYAPFDRTQQLVADLTAAGASQIRFVPVAGVGHTFQGPLLDAWTTQLEQQLART